MVAYSLKARIVETQQLAIARQWPVNNRGMLFFASSTNGLYCMEDYWEKFLVSTQAAQQRNSKHTTIIAGHAL
jgi:hypothetical protein